MAASFGGSDAHPIWYLNLEAAGGGTVTDRGTTERVTMRRLTGDTRSHTWDRLVAAFPGFGAYEQLTDRDIPVVALQITAPG